MIGGTSVKAFPVPPLPTLGELAEGSLVKLNEDGAPVEFYVAKHDYESELNGAGRTLVVRKDVYDKRQWRTPSYNMYADSQIDRWFNDTYKKILDSNIQTIVVTTKLYYTPGGISTTVDILERSVFALSLTELGETHGYANEEGTVLPIANILRIAFMDTNPSTQWTRSPNLSPAIQEMAFRLNSSGGEGSDYCDNRHGSRPCFTLPSTVLVDEAMNIVA